MASDIASIANLFLAYRQAKSAAFREQRGIGLIEFAQYERSLEDNLSRLSARLQSTSEWFDTVTLGHIWTVPKGVEDLVNKESISRIGVSAPTVTAVAKPVMDIRLQLSPSVDFLVVEVLYLWLFGAAIDANLPSESLGNRLALKTRSLSKEQLLLFEYWPTQYQRFRTEPLAAARQALKYAPNDGCYIASIDLASFYDSIDPSFLLEATFVSQLDSIDIGRYMSLTKSLLTAYKRYRAAASSLLGVRVERGIPIGTLTSKLISNVTLLTLDTLIASNDEVICYRRYVDDMTIVARRAISSLSPFDVVNQWIPLKRTKGKELVLDEAKLQRSGSRLSIQSKKFAIYELVGPEGQEFLHAVDSDVRRVDSERRLFIDPVALHGETLAALARVSETTPTNVRVIRDSDRVRLANLELGTAVQVLQRIAILIEPSEARKVINEILGPILNVLITSSNWIERMELIQKLLRISLLARDLSSASTIIRHIEESWGSIAALRLRYSTLRWNGRNISRWGVFQRVRNYMQRKRLEAVYASLRAGVPGEELSLRYGDNILDLSRLILGAQAFCAADLRTLDREDDTSSGHPENELLHGGLLETLRLDPDLRSRFDQIERFIARCKALGVRGWAISAVALFASTRPPSYFDVSHRWLLESERDGCRVAPAVADRGPRQIRTRRFPPSGSSVGSSYGVFQICTLILATGSG